MLTTNKSAMAENNLDNFSSLPDSLLFIIVSLLPFKEAARTTFLSRRWRHIWLSTKNIQLHESFFVKQLNEKKEDDRANFINFAKNWIQNYQEPVAYNFEFSFSNPNETHLPDIQNLIKFANTRILKLLDLDFSDPNWTDEGEDHQEPIIKLPSLTEENKALETIRLFSCKFIAGEFCKFRALKSISLGWISLTPESLEPLLTNCAQLEELSLKKCWDLDILNINSSNLQILMVDKCSSLEYGMCIETPNLRLLKYSGPIIPYDVPHSNSLVEADLDYGLEPCFNHEYGDDLYQIVSDMCCVRVLTVCSYMLQVIPTGEELLSLKRPLSMLQHLTLKASLDPTENFGITFFLNSCPNLQALTLELQPYRFIFNVRVFSKFYPELLFLIKSHVQDGSWLSKQRMHQFSGNTTYPIIYSCLETSLKMVEFKGFKGEINELRLLQYFICYGTILELLLITISDEKGENGEDLTSVYQSNALKLCDLKKASPKLDVFVV